MKETRTIADLMFLPNGSTLLCVDGDLPKSDWRNVIIQGKEYAPTPAMDMHGSFSIPGTHDIIGETVEFV